MLHDGTGKTLCRSTNEVKYASGKLDGERWFCFQGMVTLPLFQIWRELRQLDVA
jgi:hypothetical protein